MIEAELNRQFQLFQLQLSGLFSSNLLSSVFFWHRGRARTAEQHPVGVGDTQRCAAEVRAGSVRTGTPLALREQGKPRRTARHRRADQLGYGKGLRRCAAAQPDAEEEEECWVCGAAAAAAAADPIWEHARPEHGRAPDGRVTRLAFLTRLLVGMLIVMSVVHYQSVSRPVSWSLVRGHFYALCSLLNCSSCAPPRECCMHVNVL